MLMKWKSLFAAALSAVVAWPALAQSSTGGGTPAEGGGRQQSTGTAPGRVISVNVIGGNNPNGTWIALPSIKGTEGQSGLADYRVDNANWNELTQQNSGNTGGTPETLEALVDNTGAATVATITARLGGWWHLQGTEASEAARMNTVGYMGVGFCDPSKVADTNELTIANVPYTEYSLILYYGTNNPGNTWAAPKVTFADGTFKTYTYAADATGAATEGSAAWGSTTATTTSGQAGTLGKDVMLIEGLSGDIYIDLGTQPNNGAAPQAGSLCGFQIVCTGKVIEELIDPAKEGVISLNFGSDQRAVPENATTYGLVPVAGAKWQNFSGKSGTDVDITRAENTDLADAPTVTFSASGTWENSAATDPFMYGYLDDNDTISEATDGVAVSVDVANVPFGAYDVIVYQSTDSTSYEFFPVQVNSAYYRWDDALGTTVRTTDTSADAAFGQGAQAATAYGVNAIRVKAQTGALALRTLPRVFVNQYGQNQRGCLAALQLVERKVIKVTGTGFDLADALAAYYDDTPVLITFEEGATVTGDVTLPADAVVDLTVYTFGETAPFGGALAVNDGTEIRLPGGAVSYTLASSITGTFGLVMQDGTYITDDVTVDGGTITRPATYEWVGGTDGNNWSNRANWSSGMVPDENSAVTVTLADGAHKTITLDTAATVASLTITGPASGTATLAIDGAETASLTIAGQMATSGNVTVTQSADITVNGAATAAEGNVPAGYYAKGSFDVNGATYTLSAGTLTVGNLESGVFLVGNGATFTVGGGEEAATLSFPRTGVLYPIPSVDSRIIVAANGTLSPQSALDTPSDRYKWELAGGTLALATETAPRIRVFGGIEVSGDSTLSFVAQTANIIAMGENPSALTGEGDLALIGSGTFSFGTSLSVTSGAPLTGYTGELSVPSGLTLVLGEARPALTVAEGATVNITPTAEEQAAGRIAFGTSMTAVPSATFTVEGVDAVTPEVDNGTLTLSWEASTATLATTGDWSAFNWTVGETTGQTAPTSGVVVLDGTAEGGITVTLDTKLTDEAGASLFQRIFVKGTVNLVITSAQPTLPALAFDTGVTLGVGQRAEGVTETSKFTSAWEMDETMTLDLQGPFDFANAETLGGTTTVVGGNLVLSAEGMTYSLGLGNLRVEGSLAVTASNVTIEGLSVVLGDTLMLTGDNITIKGDGNGATIADVAVTSSGNNNAIIGITSPCKTIDVTGGSLTYGNVARSPVARLGGVLLSNGATLKLASDWATGQTLHIAAANNDTTNTVLDMSAVAATNRPTIARWGSSVYRLPKRIVVKPSEAEESANVITLALEAPTDGNPGPALQEDAVADVRSSVQTWVPVIEKSAENTLTITNVPAPDGLTGLDAAIELTVRQAARNAGIKGAYTVQLTTKGQPVEVTAAALNDVLGCFTGLKATANAEGTTLTYAYDFGIVGVKRDTNGWVVTAKVQGANAEAGFAKGNDYTLTVNGTEVSVAGATVGEGGTVTLPLPGDKVTGDAVTLGVKVSRRAQTPAQ